MFSTSVFKGAIAAVCLISLFGVLAMPDISLIDEYSVDNSTLHRNRRGGGGQDLAEAVEALDQWSDKFKENLAKEIAQCRNFGCHKNKYDVNSFFYFHCNFKCQWIELNISSQTINDSMRISICLYYILFIIF